MISKEDLENISIGLGEDYGGGWQDYDLYYKGKHIATYKCSGHVRMVIDEEVYRKLEIDEQVEAELKEMFPKTMLTDEQFEKAKEIANSEIPLKAVQYIHSVIPDEGLKGAKAYFDLYLDNRRY